MRGKYVLAVAMVAVTMIAVFSLLLARQHLRRNRANAVVAVDPQVFEWGEVRNPQSLAASFEITNRTSQTIEIRGVEVSCNCADVSLSSRSIAPSQTVTVRVTANASQAHGQFSVLCRLRTNLASVPWIELPATALVIRDDALDFSYSLDPVPAGRRFTRIIHLAGDTDSQLTEAAVTGGICPQVRILPARSNVMRVELTDTAPSDKRAYTAALLLSARNLGWKRARFHVVAPVLKIWDYPAEVFLGIIRPGVRKEFEIKLREAFLSAGTGHGPSDFRVESAPAWCDVRVTARSWSKATVTVAPKGDSVSGSRVSGQCVITTPEILGMRDRLQIQIYGLGRSGHTEAAIKPGGSPRVSPSASKLQRHRR